MNNEQSAKLRDETCQKMLDESLPVMYAALERAQITYSEDQIEHVAEDSFKAGWNARHTADEK